MFYKKPTLTKYWNQKEEKYEFKITITINAIVSLKAAEKIGEQVLAVVTEAEGQEVFK